MMTMTMLLRCCRHRADASDSTLLTLAHFTMQGDRRDLQRESEMPLWAAWWVWAACLAGSCKLQPPAHAACSPGRCRCCCAAAGASPFFMRWVRWPLLSM